MKEGKISFCFITKKNKNKVEMGQFGDRKQKLSMQSWTISKTHMCKTKITSWQVSKITFAKKSSNNHFQKALKKNQEKERDFHKIAL